MSPCTYVLREDYDLITLKLKSAVQMSISFMINQTHISSKSKKGQKFLLISAEMFEVGGCLTQVITEAG